MSDIAWQNAGLIYGRLQARLAEYGTLAMMLVNGDVDYILRINDHAVHAAIDIAQLEQVMDPGVLAGTMADNILRERDQAIG